MFRSPLFPIFLTVLVDVMALTLVLPLLPYYAQHFGASPVVVTALAASFSACQLISGPILGRISDRVGRKPTLLVSQMGTFVGFLILGSAHTLWMLFLGRIIDGLTAGNLSIAQAYISDVTKPENRTKAFALVGIAFGTGFLVGPAISGFLGHRYGYEAPAFMAAALSLTSILVTWLVLPEPARAPASVREGEAASAKEAAAAGEPGGRLAGALRFLRRPAPRIRLLEFLAFSLSFSTLIGGLALFLERRFSFNVEQTGYIYAFSGLVGGLMQGGIGRLAKRLGEEKLALAGFVAMALGYGLLSVAFKMPVLLALTAISAAGSAVVRPALTTLLTKSVDRSEQGLVLGVSQSLSSSASIVGPMIAGFLIEHRRLGSYGLTAGAFALAGAVLFLVTREPGTG
jgi:DHA1 family tetracycline resistance protein-like MFS transporter